MQLQVSGAAGVMGCEKMPAQHNRAQHTATCRELANVVCCQQQKALLDQPACAAVNLLAAADNSTPLPHCQEIMAFLKGQFLHDVIGPEMSVGVHVHFPTSRHTTTCSTSWAGCASL